MVDPGQAVESFDPAGGIVHVLVQRPPMRAIAAANATKICHRLHEGMEVGGLYLIVDRDDDRSVIGPDGSLQKDCGDKAPEPTAARE